jgi:hypothetical protein
MLSLLLFIIANIRAARLLRSKRLRRRFEDVARTPVVERAGYGHYPADYDEGGDHENDEYVERVSDSKSVHS